MALDLGRLVMLGIFVWSGLYLGGAWRLFIQIQATEASDSRSRILGLGPLHSRLGAHSLGPSSSLHGRCAQTLMSSTAPACSLMPGLLYLRFWEPKGSLCKNHFRKTNVGTEGCHTALEHLRVFSVPSTPVCSLRVMEGRSWWMEP